MNNMKYKIQILEALKKIKDLKGEDVFKESKTVYALLLDLVPEKECQKDIQRIKRALDCGAVTCLLENKNKVSDELCFKRAVSKLVEEYDMQDKSAELIMLYFAHLFGIEVTINTSEANEYFGKERRVPKGAISEKVKKYWTKKTKRILVLACFIAILIIGLIIFIFVKFTEGKIQIPFSPDYVTGMTYEEVNEELTKAGFTDITLKFDYSGWQESNTVINVSIDNAETYNKGDYIKPDVDVTITSSSLGRKYVSDILQNWPTSDYESVVQKLRKEGFNNITVNSEDSFVKANDKHVASIILNELDYSGEQCYLPPSSSIIITYYDYKIGIGSTNSQFIGQDYEDVVAKLKDSGFKNVTKEKIVSGWAKGNSVISVTVNNLESYLQNDIFDPNVKIVVKYSSGDRMEATSAVKNWETTNYEKVISDLKAKGFTNIITEEVVTYSKSNNLLVSSIKIGNDYYSLGDCYIQLNTTITIQYYKLKIQIRSKSSNFEGKSWSEVKDELAEMGFTNIDVSRSDDLSWWDEGNGLFGTGLGAKTEGSIRTVEINGRSDFTETEEFYYNDKIHIIVNTVKDKPYSELDDYINKSTS